MAGLLAQTPVVVTGAGTRSPAVEALLQGPEEYAAAMEGYISDDESAALLEATRMFEAGISLAGLQYPGQPPGKTNSTDPLYNALRNGSVRLSTYAVGRAAVVDAMHAGYVDNVWVFNPKYVPKRKPSPEIRKPQLDDNIDQKRIGIGSPREMTKWPNKWEMPLHAGMFSQGRSLLNALLTDFGIGSDETVSGQLSKLEATWSNPEMDAQRRLDALKIWYQIAVGGAAPQPDSFGAQFTTTDALLGATKKLLDIIRSIDPKLHDRSETDEESALLDMARLVLGELIRTSYERSALLPEFFDRLASGEYSTMGVYGYLLVRAAGAVFAGSQIYGYSSRHGKTLSDGALRFLDVAGMDNRLFRDLRLDAFCYGLYAIPLFGPPSGPQILHDFALWRMQREEGWSVGTMARAYGSLYTAEGTHFDGTFPPNRVQRGVVLEALKRRDLSPDERRSLWNFLTRNAGPFVAAEMAIRRRFGQSADPRP